MDTNEMYFAESYLSVKMIQEVMAEFNWPVKYTVIQEDDFFDIYVIKFPTCEIELHDVPEDGINLTFLTYDSGKEVDADYADVVALECIDNYNPSRDLNLELMYTDLEDRTRKILRNKLKNLQFYHMKFITGEDYGWVCRYLERKHQLQ